VAADETTAKFAVELRPRMSAAFFGRQDAGGIYLIRNRATGDVYVGSTASFGSRRKSHEARLRRGNHHNRRLQADYIAHGPQSFSFEVVAVVADAPVRLAIEEATIAQLYGHGCYNATLVSPPVHTGVKRSAETRARIRDAQLNRSDEVRANYFGRPCSEETRRKISEAHRGKKRGPLSREHRERIGAGQRGRKLSPEHAEILRQSRIGAVHSDEARERMAAAKRGRKHTAEHRAKVGAASLGRRHTPEAKAKISAAFLGRRPTPETRAKMSASRRAYLEKKRGQT